MKAALIVSVVILSVAIILFLSLMVAVRALRVQVEARREKIRTEARTLLVRASAGDASTQDLEKIASSPNLFDDVTGQLLAKIRGEAKEQLVSVLELRGTIKSAIKKTSNLSMVSRCRAGSFLGAVGSTDAFDALVVMLGDRSGEVRAVATRALGQLGDPAAVLPLLLGVDGPKKKLAFGSVLVAVVKIGSSGSVEVRAALKDGMEGCRGAAVEALGLLGAVEAVPDLVEHLRTDTSLDVRIRCARALGRIGSPQARIPLSESLNAVLAQSLRLVACSALAQLGDSSVGVQLASLTSDTDLQVARAAARATARLGAVGKELLLKVVTDESVGSMFAKEALARIAVEQAAITSPMLRVEDARDFR